MLKHKHDLGVIIVQSLKVSFMECPKSFIYMLHKNIYTIKMVQIHVKKQFRTCLYNM